MSVSNTKSKLLHVKSLLSQPCSNPTLLRTIHAHLLRLSLHQNLYFVDAMLRAYFDFGRPNEARIVFYTTREPNIYIWNTMIRGFVSHDWFSQAVWFYVGLTSAGFLPNNFTFPFVLKACGRLLHLELGRGIHAHVMKLGFQFDVFVRSGLMSMYAKCDLGSARKLFDEIPVMNVVCWTTMIGGYIEDEQYAEAVDLYGKMLSVGLVPDEFIFVRVLSACTLSGDMRSGEEVHRHVEERCLGRSLVVATSLVDMYAKFGNMEKSRQIFDGIKEKDVVCWSTLVSGYSLNGLPKEALDVFFLMLETNVKPDGFTLVAVLSACARTGALGLGNKIKCMTNEQECLVNPVLGTALIDMYGKCGSVTQAWDIFNRMVERDTVVWNAMISALAMSGNVRSTFSLFNQIGKLGFNPNGNTFLGLLCACVHAGLVDEGRHVFKCMIDVYGVAPAMEHYGCLVDLLGRSGFLDEAHQVIETMSLVPNSVVWGALLGSCKIHKNTNLAEHALRHLIELEPCNAGNYVLLSNIYSVSGRWDDAAKLRLLMSQRNIQKTPGCSWIEVNGLIHEFQVGDCSHPMSGQIYRKLNELSRELKAIGYLPSTDVVFFDLEDEEKAHFLGYHSEKLAVSFGLIVVAPNDPIRVMKNLRVCDDCHTAIKLISKITARQIVLRDNNRFHSFKDGMCSCNDFW